MAAEAVAATRFGLSITDPATGDARARIGRMSHVGGQAPDMSEYALAPLRVRGLAKVALHADLCILARLGLR
jgi:hypothetical protein